MARVVVLGAGMMGTALVVPLADAGHTVALVGTHLDEERLRGLESGAHPGLGVGVPASVTLHRVGDLRALLDGADAVALGVNSLGVTWAAEQLRSHGDLPVLMVSKGLDREGDELRLLPDVFERVRGPGIEPVAVAGPCIAGELARRVPSIVLFACRSRDEALRWQRLATTSYYRPHPSVDFVGTEVCAALKNAYALGVAIAAGEHERLGGRPGSVARHNLEAATFAQALREMETFVGLMGGDRSTVAGLAGAGDLDVTCNGGRTGRLGRWLGLGVGRERALQEMAGATLESLELLQVVRPIVERWLAAGTAPPGSFPLLQALAAIALDDAPATLPFERYFGAVAP